MGDEMPDVPAAQSPGEDGGRPFHDNVMAPSEFGRKGVLLETVEQAQGLKLPDFSLL
jgi:hypothetical protein